MMRTSISDMKAYRDTCMRCAHDKKMFDNFRTNPVLNEIWEHVSYEQGHGYLRNILTRWPGTEMLERACENDKFGGPRTNKFSLGGCTVFGLRELEMSPTTLRYVKVALDLFDMIGSSLFSANIVEIGGGYGGQATVINTSGDYVIYDLPEVCSLIARFVASVRPNSNIFTVNSFRHSRDETRYDLVISNYAWSELNKNVQLEYFDGVMRNCDNGYVTCNFISDKFGIDSLTRDEIRELFKDKNVSICDEEPLTYPGNMVIKWTK